MWENKMKKYNLYLLIFILVSVTISGWAPLKSAQRYYSLAESDFQNSEYLNALDNYRKALKVNSYYKEAQIGMGKTYLKIKNYDKALSYFKMAESQAQSDVNIKVWIAKTQIERKNYSSAEAYLIKALSIKPKDYSALTTLGDLFFSKNDYTKAIEYYTEATKQSPKNPLAYLKLGKTYLELKNPEKAIRFLESAENIDNTNPQTNFYLGEYYYKRGDLDSSEKYLKNVLNITPKDYNTLDLLYRVLFKMEKWSETKDNLEKLVQMNPKEKKYYYHLGLAYEKVNDPIRSLLMFKHGIRLDYGDEAMRYQAERIYKNYFSQNPDEVNNITQEDRKFGEDLASYWYDRGLSFLKQNEKDKALFSFKRGAYINPQHWRMRLALANIYKSKRLINKYYNELQKIKSDLNKDNTEVNDELKFAELAMQRILSRRQKIDQYQAPLSKPKIALVFFEKNNDFNHHFNVQKIYRDVLYETLKLNDRLNIVLIRNRTNFDSIYQQLKDMDVDFLISGTIKESDKDIDVSLTIKNINDGDIYKEGESYKPLKIIQRGNDRYLKSALYLADNINQLFPVFGQIIKKNNNEIFINLGTRQGYKKGDSFFVIRNEKTLSNLFNDRNLYKIIKSNRYLSRTLLSLDGNNRFGLEEILITEIDENIAKARIVTSDFFDEVNINNYVIYKPR